MNAHTSCPCCSESMLHHLSGRRNYWYCAHCRLEMPNSYHKVERRKNHAVKFNPPLNVVIPTVKPEKPAIAY